MSNVSIKVQHLLESLKNLELSSTGFNVYKVYVKSKNQSLQPSRKKRDKKLSPKHHLEHSSLRCLLTHPQNKPSMKESVLETNCKERLGGKQYGSPPRQSIQERRVSSSREESQRRTPAKERLGKRPASSGQENPNRANQEPKRRSKRTRDL